MEGDTPFSKFKEGHNYRIHLEENSNDTISFLGDENAFCSSHGIEEINLPKIL